MRKLLCATLAALAGLAALPDDALAGSVLTATLHNDGVEVADGGGATLLTGWFDLNFTGNVGANVAGVAGLFHTTGGTLAPHFGGVGGTSGILTAGLGNFANQVTGRHGIDTAPEFCGDIFAEAQTFPSQPFVWGGNPSNMILFDFGYLTLQGTGGAVGYIGLGSTSPTMGEIYRHGSQVYVNFWLDRSLFNVPGWAPQTGYSGDWLAAVTSHHVDCPDPIPEPSAFAMGALALAGLSAWGWRRQRRARARAL